MKKNTVCIKGMHCRSCELLVEDELLKVPGVKKAIVSQRAGTAEIECDCEIDPKHIEQAVNNAGYCLGVDEKPLLSTNPRDWRDLGIAIFLALDLFFVAKGLGLFHISWVSSNNYSSLPIVFLVGLTAGVSTCMALIGGLVLGASAKFAEKHPNATTAQKCPGFGSDYFLSALRLHSSDCPFCYGFRKCSYGCINVGGICYWNRPVTSRSWRFDLGCQGRRCQTFLKTAGVVVIFLALFNINNGYNLTGFNFNPGEIIATIFGPVSVAAVNNTDPNVT